jgi:aristolochene synthase
VSIPASEQDAVRDIEMNIAAHVCIVNDLFSWEKELLDAAAWSSDLINAVSVVMREEDVNVTTAQFHLSSKVQNLESTHYELLERYRTFLSVESKRYVEFLVTMASGNESWSRLT